MDVSESECNIVNETLSQSDSSDVRTNVITEFNYDEHIEPSAIFKGESYFNIFECGRNILDKLDVTYQRAFTAYETSSKVPTRHSFLQGFSPAYHNIFSCWRWLRMSCWHF